MFSKCSKTEKIVFILIFLTVLLLAIFQFTDLDIYDFGIKNNNNDSSLFTEQTNDATFQYSKELGAEYVYFQDWPPKLRVIDKEDKIPPKFNLVSNGVACQEENPEESTRSSIINKEINGRMYCVETLSEGAAGSVYTEYSYSTTLYDKVITLSFVLRFPNCQNYEAQERLKCQNEREDFSVDNVISQITRTITFTK